MNTKHTPGPWHLIETKNIRNPELVNYLLCNKSPHCHGILDGVNSKDADLIAAAPEMLETIATLYTLANLQSLLETKYSKALVHDLMSQMENVISKARGES